MNCFQAPMRWSVTATPACDSLANLQGLCHFHERPSWGDPKIKLNIEPGIAAEKHVEAFAAWQEAVRQEPRPADNGQKAHFFPPDDSVMKCPSEAEEGSGERLCHHFPALLEIYGAVPVGLNY